MVIKKRGKGKEPLEAKRKREIKERERNLENDVSRIVKVHYWQPYRLVSFQKMSFPPSASLLKKLAPPLMGVMKKREKGQKISCVELAICPDLTSVAKRSRFWT